MLERTRRLSRLARSRDGRARGSTLALAAALFASGMLAAPGRAAAQDRLVEASRLIDQGKHKAALKDLEKYVVDFPDRASGWILCGRALHGMARYAEALDAHRRASEMPDSMPAAAYHAARACDRLEKLDDAFVWLDRAIDAGFSDWAAMLADPDLERCRRDPRFEQRRPSSLDPKRPFVEQLVLRFDGHGEMRQARYGWSAADIGDVDADRCPDFAVGAPFHSDGYPNGGKVYVYSGRKCAELITVSAANDEQMGWAIGAAGDVNKDGKLDFWTSAPGQNGHPGGVYVLSGVDGAQLKYLPGQGTNDRFGESVCVLGDLDQDGVAELVIAAPGNDAAGEDCGRLYVVSPVDGSVFATFEGRRPLDRLGGGGVSAWVEGGQLRIAACAPKAGEDRKGHTYVWSALDDREPRVLVGDASARSRGGRIGYVGDLDGDGMRDLFASDEVEDRATIAASVAWAWSSASGERCLQLASPLSGDAFARSFSRVADYDGDGLGDLAIGAWRSRRGGPYCGAVTIHSGDARKGAPVIARVTGGLARIGVGFSVAPLADIDGDGVPELIVTAPFDAARGPETGRAFVVSGAELAAQARTR